MLETSAAAAAAAAASAIVPNRLLQAAEGQRAGAPRLRFGVIGIDHGHIYGMTDAVVRGGGELVSFHANEPTLAAAFASRYPNAKQVSDERSVLEDPTISLILSSIIPNERAPLGIRAMRAGKDFACDKPGITSLTQLADVKRVQAETKRIYSIVYSERLESRATVRAGQLVHDGAIGTVVQTVGLGPHRVHPPDRPEWFWDPNRYGGILCDIGTHQFDQFLFFTRSTSAEVVAAQVRNVRYPERPAFQDFGDALVRGNGGTGYLRVDWFTPAGLPTWGDGRLTILGTDGYIEVRKYVDLTGRPGGDHLFIADAKGVRYVDSRDVELPYGRQLVDDVLGRTETAMSQAHCFLVTELALRAQAVAHVVRN
ncbi:MAG TPA: Gfo/Idh/MocA family oxidoreductase [Gemmatimonadaceae bacterium]|nr:Gfo/Idh/MocA family oxidoreductase [Gemmatimonadaceae bacterium]